MTNLKIESVHCDRLSITGNLDWIRTRSKAGEYYYDSETLRYLFNPVHYKISHYPCTDSFLYTDNFSVAIESVGSSIFIQTNRRHTNDRGFRVDFNPSKLNDEERAWLLDLLKPIKDKRATRVDVATNFYHDLSDYKLTDGRLRSSIEYKDRYGSLETLYRGSQNSDNYLKLYDKRKEQQSKYKTVNHSWWRVEETLTGKQANAWANHDWFSGIQLTTDRPILPDGLRPHDMAAVFCLIDNRMTLDDFSKNTRTKLRKIINLVRYEGGLNLHQAIKKAPYQQMLDSALKDIGRYLNDCGGHITT